MWNGRTKKQRVINFPAHFVPVAGYVEDLFSRSKADGERKYTFYHTYTAFSWVDSEIETGKRGCRVVGSEYHTRLPQTTRGTQNIQKGRLNGLPLWYKRVWPNGPFRWAPFFLVLHSPSYTFLRRTPLLESCSLVEKKYRHQDGLWNTLPRNNILPVLRIQQPQQTLGIAPRRVVCAWKNRPQPWWTCSGPLVGLFASLDAFQNHFYMCVPKNGVSYSYALYWVLTEGAGGLRVPTELGFWSGDIPNATHCGPLSIEISCCCGWLVGSFLCGWVEEYRNGMESVSSGVTTHRGWWWWWWVGESHCLFWYRPAVRGRVTTQRLMKNSYDPDEIRHDCSNMERHVDARLVWQTKCVLAKLGRYSGRIDTRRLESMGPNFGKGVFV